MTHLEQLKYYVDTLNFVKFQADVSDSKRIEYEIVNEDGKYYCDITEVTKCETEDGRPARSTRQSRMHLDALSDDTLEMFAASMKEGIEKLYVENIKEMSKQTVGTPPTVLNKEILKNIGFKEDTDDSSLMMLKFLDKEFYIDIERRHMDCKIITCTPAGDEERHVFQYVSAHPFYVHHLVLAMKLCGILVED